MSRADDLISRFLHGLATEEERAELDRLIAESPDAADAFARASRLDHALERQHREEGAISLIQGRIRRRRRLVAAVAAGALLAILLPFLLGGPAVLARKGGAPLHAGDVVAGPALLDYDDGSTIRLAEGSEFELGAPAPGKRGLLRRGRLSAAVAKQAHPMILRTPSAEAVVVGTRFVLSAEASATRLEVTEGKVRLENVDVAVGEVAEARGAKVVKTREDRFETLWRELHDPANGYFSADGLPYHSIETFIVDAPDHGHLSTSETFSYWLWLEARHGRASGDWSPFTKAWRRMEEVLIPSRDDQPSAGAYDPKKPATYVPEAERLADYPVAMDPSVATGADALYEELRAAYGGPELHIMHWLLDVDGVHGYGRNAFVNLFQRGPRESVWKTIPHPSKERFQAGGPNGFLDLFLKEPAYAKQWRYTGAPDADARAIQAALWAARWAREQGKTLPLDGAARMGDSLRYALQGKYFQGRHGLLSWSQAWGGSLDAASPWAWRAGSDHVHAGYQNPVAAWALVNEPALAPKSPGAARDWTESLRRQLDLYRWLQSAEGAIAGGADAGPDGLKYVEHPVFLDPPSNEWFGWQAWSMGRLAEYARLANDARAKAVVDKWAAWVARVVRLNADGGYEIPATLKWSGRPDPWNPAAPGPNAGLHVEVTGTTQDVGVTASLARALLAQGSPASRALAGELLERMWLLYRDSRGVSNPEPRDDYRRLHESAEIPAGWRGALASGGAIAPGSTFLDLRPALRKDPELARVEQALRSGKAPIFRYHRFWAQVEIALANAEFAALSN